MKNIANLISLLENKILIEIEESITQFYNCKVLYSNQELIIEVIQKDIEKSEFSIEDLKIFIVEHKKYIIDFGILLLNEDKPTEGIYFGFSILYATYLKYLMEDNKRSLLRFLELLQIPKTKMFLKQLYKIKLTMDL